MTAFDADVRLTALKAADLIDKRDWIYGFMAVNAQGLQVEPQSKEAVAWSLLGAVDRVSKDVHVRREILSRAAQVWGEQLHKEEPKRGKAGAIELLRKIAEASK